MFVYAVFAEVRAAGIAEVARGGLGRSVRREVVGGDSEQDRESAEG